MRLALALPLACVLAVPAPLVAQSTVADSSPFRPLSLPAPNGYRSASGVPGPHYWQQRADYRIRATLDTATGEIRGRETIHYVNNSPDDLPFLWLHLEQNMCGESSVTTQLDQPPLVFLGSTFDFSCKDFPGGVTLSRVAQVPGGRLPYTVQGTTMRIDLPAPLRSGRAIDLDIEWRFRVPPYGGGRMGRDGTLYEIAQWYPRMAVYDDVRGWNHEPYIGAGEFYLEYGRFDVSLTLPAGFLVAATGTLLNPLEVLTATQRRRLAQARRSEEPVAIVTAGEAGQAARTRPRAQGTLTWRFAADSVRDFAFAAAPNFRWDASGWEGILVHTFYRPTATLWTEANRMVRQALAHFSETWYRYPYPHISSVEGPIEGMEYPMLTFDPTGPAREDLQWVLAHELGHQWMPMIVGSNERLYPWMDEGFNTFIDLANTAEYFAGSAYGDTIQVHPLRLYPDHSAPGVEQPLITRPVESRDLFWTGYQKPALMLSLLRDEVLDSARFNRAFRAYIRQWAFKHPTPADFFRVMRNETGADLDWFWRGWVFSTARLDQAIDSVSSGPGGATVVALANRGTMVMPATLRVTFDGGGSSTVRLPVDMWNLGSRFEYRIRDPRRVTLVELDPAGALPDIRRDNNRWPRAGE